jgi:hypothetical protein
MTDRVSSLTVVLKEDWRVDEVDRVVNAIAMIGPVLSVTPNITDFPEHVATMRVRSEFRTKLLEFLKEWTL